MHTTADFTCQHIYTGLDISKKIWKVSILTEEVEHKTFTQLPSVEALVRYLERNFTGAHYHCVYEAGRFGFWIHDALEKRGIDCLVVNPTAVPTTNKEFTTKTARVDARKLACRLRSCDLKSIYIPPRTDLEDWSLARTALSFLTSSTPITGPAGLLPRYRHCART